MAADPQITLCDLQIVQMPRLHRTYMFRCTSLSLISLSVGVLRVLGDRAQNGGLYTSIRKHMTESCLKLEFRPCAAFHLAYVTKPVSSYKKSQETSVGRKAQ